MADVKLGLAPLKIEYKSLESKSQPQEPENVTRTPNTPSALSASIAPNIPGTDNAAKIPIVLSTSNTLNAPNSGNAGNTLNVANTASIFNTGNVPIPPNAGSVLLSHFASEALVANIYCQVMYLNLRKMPKIFLPHQILILGLYKPHTLDQTLFSN